MSKRNITLTLPPKTMEILDNLYESGLINSRTQIIEIALFEWLRNNHFLEFDNSQEVSNRHQKFSEPARGRSPDATHKESVINHIRPRGKSSLPKEHN